MNPLADKRLVLEYPFPAAGTSLFYIPAWLSLTVLMTTCKSHRPNHVPRWRNW